MKYEYEISQKVDIKGFSSWENAVAYFDYFQTYDVLTITNTETGDAFSINRDDPRLSDIIEQHTQMLKSQNELSGWAFEYDNGDNSTQP